MEIKNFLTSGDYCVPIPLGLDIQITYNGNSTISEIAILNTRTDEKEVVNDFIPTFIKERLAPVKINIELGTTTVRGVLAVEGQHAYMFSGSVDDIKDVVLEDIKAHISDYKFYAYHVWSGAANFKGSQITKKWLLMSGFNVLNGFLCPALITSDSIEHLVSYYSNQFPVIVKYFNFHEAETSYIHRNITQKITRNVTTEYRLNGFVDVKLEYTDKTNDMFPYTNRLKFGLMTNDNIILIEDGRIIYNFNYTTPENTDYTFTCSHCGRIHKIDDIDDLLTCDNSLCSSKQFVRTNRLLTGLSLPTLTEEEYIKKVGDKTTICIADMLDILGYEDDSINTTLSDAIYSVIPVMSVRVKEPIQNLCKNCNFNLKSLEYYMLNTDSILSDLPMQDNKNLRDFIAWISVPENYSEVCAIIGSTKLHIKNIDDEKKFDGAPMFNGKKIAITGTFIHGDESEIIRILKSYSATIVNDASQADCLIVGSTMSDINGKQVKLAKSKRVPIFDEVEFFNSYEIDKDLAENLS